MTRGEKAAEDRGAIEVQTERGGGEVKKESDR